MLFKGDGGGKGCGEDMVGVRTNCQCLRLQGSNDGLKTLLRERLEMSGDPFNLEIAVVRLRIARSSNQKSENSKNRSYSGDGGLQHFHKKLKN